MRNLYFLFYGLQNPVGSSVSQLVPLGLYSYASFRKSKAASEEML